jgi:hypothetical protein
MLTTTNRRNIWATLLCLVLTPVAARCQNPPPRINEIVTANITGLPDEYEVDTSNCPVPDCDQWYLDLGPSVFDGDYPDWIEIHNPGQESLELEGYGLSDDPTRPFKWIFPPVTLAPDGYLVVFASGKHKVQSYIHTSFQLDRAGELVALTAPSGVVSDQVFSGGIPIDMSMGRSPNAPSVWVWFEHPTPGMANDDEPFPGFTGEIAATPPAGFHAGPLDVTLHATDPNAEIRFTRDGSEPGLGSELFQGAIEIGETTVLRARGFLEGRLATPILTQTYLIGESSSFPVVSLATPPQHLWDPDLGIYTAGRNARESQRLANYWQPWERPVHVEFFEPDGTRAFGLDAGLQIFGWGSRSQPQKSLAIMLRNRYGLSELDYPLFPDLSLTRFSSFVLRAGGSDAVASGTFFRDAFASGLVADRNLDVQAFRPALVYINGVYFGIQNLREKMNEDYLAGHHGADPDQVDIVSRYWRRTYPVVSEGDDSAYLALETFLETHDPLVPETYEHLRQAIDLDNFLDYTAAQIWFANYDWPGNNNKVWRARTPTGRWRAFMYDLDYTLAFVPTQNHAAHNTLSHATQPNATGWPNPSWTTLLIRKLLAVPDLRDRFINRLADLMNHDLLPATTETRLDGLIAIYEPEMPRQIARWSGTGDVIPSIDVWYANLEIVRTFLRTRSPHVQSHLRDYFQLPAMHTLDVRADPPGAARLKLNSLILDSFPWSGTYFQGVPVNLDVLPAPGFRFAGWEGLPGSVDPLAPRLLLDPDRDLSLVARFEPSPGTVNAVVIHEINYHAPDVGDPGDWVELHNGYPLPVDVSGWVLKDSEDNHAWTIPDGTVLDPGDFLVVCADTAAFTARFPHVFNVHGNLGFNLGNGGDQVRLFNARHQLIDQVSYQDTAPWPLQPDGEGPTLELIRSTLDRSLPSSWRASPAIGGSPGAPNTDPFSEPTPPSLEAERVANGLLLHLETEPARTYQIQVATDLLDWVDWQWVVGSGEIMPNHILMSETEPARFFRVKLVR